jgi:dipeptidyl aminopeptidase/acylaminoacyl peptidase
MQADVFTMKTDGSDVKRLTAFSSMSWAPYFHPSGKYAVFTSNKLGFENFELFLVDAAGEREPVRVTWTDGFDGLPVFSPDGKRLAWTSNRTADRKSQLFIGGWNHPAALKALEEAPKRMRTAEEARRRRRGDETSSNASPRARRNSRLCQPGPRVLHHQPARFSQTPRSRKRISTRRSSGWPLKRAKAA